VGRNSEMDNGMRGAVWKSAAQKLIYKSQQVKTFFSRRIRAKAQSEAAQPPAFTMLIAMEK
jgi:hypothetical protein